MLLITVIILSHNVDAGDKIEYERVSGAKAVTIFHYICA